MEDQLSYPYAIEKWHFTLCPKQGVETDWDALYAVMPWFDDMEATPQSPIFHEEGNVLIHTKMVVDEILKILDRKRLHDTARSILFLSALMHDMAKPETTREEGGKIICPGHARVGARKARAFMYRESIGKVPYSCREQIVKLVKWHGLPLWSWDNPFPEKNVLRAACHTRMDWLEILAKADVLGRICADQKKLLDRLDYYAEFAKEFKVYGENYQFENPLTRFTFFQKPDSNLFYRPFDDTVCNVTMLCGLPGAGKDTWIKELGNGLPVVSLDNIRRKLKIAPKDNQGLVIQTAKEEARQYLRAKQDFIWNATNLTKQLRQGLVDLFTTYKAWVRIVYLEAPYPVLLDRNRNREHPVPPKVLERFINKLEIPELDEAHEVDYFVDH
ncbi:MAG: AAA family ATPase [Bacteroidota bacterium]